MPWPCAAVFRLSSPLVAHSAHAWPFAVATATRFRRFKRSRLTEIGAPSSTFGIQPLCRYGGARSIRDSPSDVAACHRMVRRHTCSPVTRRSRRARQAQAAPGAHVSQSAPRAISKRATGLATGPRSAWAARWQVGREHCLSRTVTKRPI